MTQTLERNSKISILIFVGGPKEGDFLTEHTHFKEGNIYQAKLRSDIRAPWHVYKYNGAGMLHYLGKCQGPVSGLADFYTKVKQSSA